MNNSEAKNKNLGGWERCVVFLFFVYFLKGDLQGVYPSVLSIFGN